MKKYEKLQNKISQIEQPDGVIEYYLVEVFNDEKNSWDGAGIYRVKDVSEEEARQNSYIFYHAFDTIKDEEHIDANWEENTRVFEMTI